MTSDQVTLLSSKVSLQHALCYQKGFPGHRGRHLHGSSCMSRKLTPRELELHLGETELVDLKLISLMSLNVVRTVSTLIWAYTLVALFLSLSPAARATYVLLCCLLALKLCPLSFGLPEFNHYTITFRCTVRWPCCPLPAWLLFRWPLICSFASHCISRHLQRSYPLDACAGNRQAVSLVLYIAVIVTIAQH